MNSNTNDIKSSPQTETERRVSDSFDGGRPSHRPLLPSGTHLAVARAKRAKRKPPQVALRTGSQQLPNRRCVKPCTVSKYPHYCKCSNPLHRTRSRHLSILTWGKHTQPEKEKFPLWLASKRSLTLIWTTLQSSVNHPRTRFQSQFNTCLAKHCYLSAERGLPIVCIWPTVHLHT